MTFKNLSKSNPEGGGWKIQLLSADMMSKKIYTSKLIGKTLNAKVCLQQSVLLSNNFSGKTQIIETQPCTKSRDYSIHYS